MRDTDSQLENALARLEAAVDRSLAIPITVQLRGALEYGIATGEIPSGAQLPSVRAFAARLKVSPVTISNVYAALRSTGLIEGRVGSGSYVTDGASAVDGIQDSHRVLQVQIDELVATAAEMGIGPTELAFRIASAKVSARRSMRILMLGIFQEATDYYASVLRGHLPSRDEVIATTFDALAQAPMPDVDVVATPKNMRAEAVAIYPDTPVVGMTFIPTEQTRIELARVAPDARVSIVSYFPEFLTLMRAGIMRFAPHVSNAEAAVWNDPDIDAVLSRCDVMVHATGADALRQRLKSGQTAIEYRHTPDPHAIRGELLPVVEAQRNRTINRDGSGEDSRKQLVRN